MYIIHSCPLSHIYEQFFVKVTFFKSMIFRAKNTFQPNVIKWVIKTNFINVKILSNFSKEGCTFGRIKRHVKNTKIVHFQYLNVLNMQKHLWHVNFAINEKYSKNNYDNPNYYASHLIFQTYKNVVLGNVPSLGWFLWLWFY
jgi:hypothetical protein